MKKLLIGLLASLPFMANAQFTPGQVLTAAELNNQFALYAPLAGATFTGPVTIPTLTVGTSIVLPNGSVALTKLASQAANTVVANVTSGTASPTAFAVPSCSTSSSALTYTTNTGFTCNTAVNAAQLGGATFASPGPIGSGTPSTGAFTNATTAGTITTTFAGGGGSTSNFVNISNSAGGPSIAFDNTTFGVDSGWWDILEGAGALYFRAVNDANNNSTFYMTVNRGSGFTVSNVSFGVPIVPQQTGGIVGTTTNNNANAGSVGEELENTSGAISLTTATSANTATVTLGAGDWDVTGSCQVNAAATTNLFTGICGVSSTSATLPATPLVGAFGSSTSFTGSAFMGFTAPERRFSVSGSTQVWLVCQSSFTTSTATCTGYIKARRRR